MSHRLCWFLVLLASLLAGNSGAAQKRKRTMDSFLRGICYTSHSAGSQSSKEILGWVKENRINLVAIDFFAVAFSYDYTNFSNIARLMKRLRKNGVTVLADYRPSTSPPGKSHRAEAPDLCLSNPEVRSNITGWGLHILEKCPEIDILTVYNPLPAFERNKDCASCKKAGPDALLEGFFEEWSEAIRKKHRKVKLGAVFPANAGTYRRLAPYLDVFVPFCSLIAGRGRTECGPGVMKAMARQMKPVRKLRPVIPLVKLYWKQATRNSTADILHAMDEARSEKLGGFFLWYRSLLTGEVAKATRYELPDYDLDAICDKYRELGGERKRKPNYRRF
ncbi:MAG: hypothetical protein ACE5F1_08200 [Planctomycetota bacterium]